MKKTICSIITVLCLTVVVCSGILVVAADDDIEISAYSESVIASGTCGEGLTWKIDNEGCLIISGTGNLANYQSTSSVPWNDYAAQIQSVNLEMNTTSLCSSSYCRAFVMLSKIKEIEIPEGVTSIPESPYLFPKKLPKLKLPSTYVGELSSNNLIRNMNYTEIEVSQDNPVYSSIDGTLFNKDKTKIVQYTKSAIEPNYIIPETVKNIDSAFYGNEYLETLTISKNVEIVNIETYNNKFHNWGIGMDAEYSNCRAVYVDKENPYFCSLDGVLYNKEMSILVWCPPKNSVDCFYVPETVKIIAAGGFNHSILNEIKLHDGVEILGRCAFSNSNINTITLTKGIKNIYSGCFYGCNKLSKVYIESDNAEFSGQIFDNCQRLKTAGPMGSGNDIEFSWTDMIPCNVFSYCKSLESIILPDSIMTIEDRAFAQCQSLKTITIPENVSTIGNSAFYQCNSLSDIYVDKSKNQILGEKWGAENATVTYLREMIIEEIHSQYTYNGQAKTPNVVIYENKTDGSETKQLIKGVDYDVSYADNVNAGTASVNILFIGSYIGTKTMTFNITPKLVTDSNISIDKIVEQAYTGREILPNPKITDIS